MLTMLLGKVGSGKSLFAMTLMLEELRRSERWIWTTLAVDEGAFNEYAQRLWPSEDLRVCQRVRRLLGKDMLAQFWRYRESEAPTGKFGTPEYVIGGRGVLYILDEAQVAFGARDWGSRCGEFTDYITQHRKLSDDVVACTPFSALVDKQFRGMAQETVVLENWYQRRIGMFTLPRRIVWKKYCNCPPAVGEISIAKGSIRIDAKALAACYRTEEGVGVIGNAGADKGKVAKGVPWYMSFAGLIAIGCAVWWGVGKALAFGTKMFVPRVSQSVQVSARAPETQRIVAQKKGTQSQIAAVSDDCWSGASKRLGRSEVWLRSGRKLDTSYGDTIIELSGGRFMCRGQILERCH